MPMPPGSLTRPLRRLAAHPTFAFTAIVTLALGIGASTAIYSVAYGVLLRPLPFDRPEQLVSLTQLDASRQPLRFSRPNYEDVAEAAHSYRDLARYSAGQTAVVGGTTPVMVTGAWVSDSFLAVLRVAPAQGRPFLVEEHTPGGPGAILISQAFWRQHLEDGADPLDGNAAQRTQAFSTFAFVVRGPANPLDAAADAREAVRAVVPEVPVSTRAVDDLVAATYGNQRFSLIVVLLFAAAALLLAISGLYGVSSYAVSSRTREIGVRMVLGADARGIGGLVLREGLWLVALGSVAGVSGVVAVSRLFASALADLGELSPPVVALAVGVVGVCALAACLVPARRAARMEPATAIREA